MSKIEEKQKFSTVEEVLQTIKEACQGFSGDTAEKTADFVDKISKHYAEKLGFTQFEVINSMETRRSYSAPNYYQAAHFPNLEKATVYETTEDMMKAMSSKKWRCPCCNGISTNPYECNSGLVRKDGKICDWKSYGLFGCMGKGFTFTIRDRFLETGKFDTIFYPIDLESEAN